MPEQAQKDIILAGLSAAGQNTNFSPVQIQKLFFIIDREISELIEGQKFNFKPYDYGPFDKAVYETLEVLFMEEAVQISNSGQYNRYALTASGFEEGRQIFDRLPDPAQNFIAETANWVKSLNFEELVAAIYKKYPDMKENSVFKA